MNQRQEFVLRFQQLQPKFPRLCARYLMEANLTLPQFVLLTLLCDLGTIPMTEVSEKLHITKPAVTNLVDRLEKGKYLRRLPHPNDRRVSLIEILPKGQRFVREMQNQILQPLLKAWDTLDAKSKETVNQFYGLLSEVMDGEFKFEETKK